MKKQHPLAGTGMSEAWPTIQHAMSRTMAEASSPPGPFCVRTDGDPMIAYRRSMRVASRRGGSETNFFNDLGSGSNPSASMGSQSTLRGWLIMPNLSK